MNSIETIKAEVLFHVECYKNNTIELEEFQQALEEILEGPVTPRAVNLICYLA